MRGQAHTLEAVVAGILLLTSLVFALQVTAVTPLSASTANQHIENQHQSSANGVLSVAADRGVLKDAVLYWNATGTTFHNADADPTYVNKPPTNGFGDILDSTFSDRGVTFNVYVAYQNNEGNILRQNMVFRGEPSDNAVTATRTVTLFDDDVLYDTNGNPTKDQLNDPNVDFYAPDAAPNSGVYNVVRMEVVVWRL